MQLFSEGKSSGWNHIYNKTEYETIRDGSKLGIRWKITCTIDNYYYFGYNIFANVWTEGVNFGRQIKANSPNRGEIIAYFPSETEYLWFDKGYSVNEINSCRIIINSTNGGSLSYDTGSDRTVTTPTGYVASTINSGIDFNIGNNLGIVINDITNQNYNYKLYLDIYNESNAWQNVKYLETTSKNFALTLSDIATTLYNLLPNSNTRPCRLIIETYIGSTHLGTNIREGTVYVTNSNPDTPDFAIFGASGGTTLQDAITSIWAGYGPYNSNSLAYIAVKDSSLLAKNGATLKKIVIECNGEVQEVNL